MSTDVCAPHESNENKATAGYVSTPGRPWWLPILELFGILCWLFFWISYIHRIANSVSLASTPIILAVFAGILASDFMSGFLHWLFDTFFEETTPIIGPHLVGPFRTHHRDPLAMTRHHILESAGNSCIAWLPVMSIVWWFGPLGARTFVGVFGYWFIATWTFFLTFSNQLHSWAHAPAAAPRLARRLQSWGFFVSPEHHAPHHITPHRTRYCTTTGWINYVTDRFSIFVYLEKAFVALGVPLKSPNSD